MALTLSEARAVNDLLRWFLGQPTPDGTPVGIDDASAAAVFLADRAYGTLGAGLTGPQVRVGFADLLTAGMLGDA